MQLKIEQNLFDRLMKLATELNIPYRRVATEAIRIGLEAMWHKYYADARIVALYKEGGKEKEFCELETGIKENFDESSS